MGNATDTEKELWLSYYSGRLDVDISNKSASEISDLLMAQQEKTEFVGKDWHPLKEEPDYTHLVSKKIKHVISWVSFGMEFHGNLSSPAKFSLLRFHGIQLFTQLITCLQKMPLNG